MSRCFSMDLGPIDSFPAGSALSRIAADLKREEMDREFKEYLDYDSGIFEPQTPTHNYTWEDRPYTFRTSGGSVDISSSWLPHSEEPYPNVVADEIYRNMQKLFKLENEKEQKKMELDTVRIMRNTLGDTRTATKLPNFAEFDYANAKHKSDVERVMSELARAVERAGRDHDNTKKLFAVEFYRDFCRAFVDPTFKFEESEWARCHYDTERHHLDKVIPPDLNLIDILETITDQVCAGKTRTNDFTCESVKIDPDILMEAFVNTVKMIDEATKVIEPDKSRLKDLAEKSPENYRKNYEY